ncbi:MAG: SH3 domain-containing protein [Pseudonocardia sp.]|nr:SH3 domain-containing protein [Pseudonocardia sp.]
MAVRRSGRSGRRRVLPAAVVLVSAAVLTGCAQTSIPGVKVRTGPGTGYPVTGTIPQPGTAVAVTCWSRGDAVLGDTVWYRIRSPQAGYVTNYYIRTTGDYANTEPC